jgi:hypothetical protein
MLPHFSVFHSLHDPSIYPRTTTTLGLKHYTDMLLNLQPRSMQRLVSHINRYALDFTGSVDEGHKEAGLLDAAEHKMESL